MNEEAKTEEPMRTMTNDEFDAQMKQDLGKLLEIIMLTGVLKSMEGSTGEEVKKNIKVFAADAGVRLYSDVKTQMVRQYGLFVEDALDESGL